jgi:2,3,4,5-tetrahydropyridine-2,6-dicarboxylate N-succinyltransferase
VVEKHVVDVTVETFREEVVERSKKTLVLVDLWATWCGPCKTLGPALEKVAKELAGKVVVAKIDVDQNPELAEMFGAQSIPTVVLIKDGRPIDGFVGARSEVAEGVIVETGSVLSMGVFIGASTKIVDRHTGDVFMGRVPAYSVVVPGALPGKPLPDGTPGPSTYCAVIVKRVDEKTRAKTSINELLRG